MARFSIEKRHLKQIDWWLVGAMLLLTAFGILVIDGTTAGEEIMGSFARRQILWWAISLAIFSVLLCFDYAQLSKLAVPAYLVCLALLAGLLWGKPYIPQLIVTKYGATSWYRIGGNLFQPSEITKIAVVLAAAAYLARIKARQPGWRDLIVVAVLVLMPAALVKMQPDFGTAVTFLPLMVAMPWAAGVHRRIYLVLGIVALAAAIAYGTIVAVTGEFPFLNANQTRRVRAYLAEVFPRWGGGASDENLADTIRKRDRWQPLQARIALGSGRIWGKGWRQGTQTRLEFLPKAHFDYIFASCGEQFGFVGCVFVLTLYTLIVFRATMLSLRSKDWFGYLLIIGVLTVFITHVALNIGVSTDLLPVTGLPLPFMSYGGSFLLTNYIGFALVVNVGMRKYIY